MPDLAIDARDLTRTFGSFTAVDRITFDVRVGEVFGFLGANGAGKTTAIRMLTGLLVPSGGTAKVAGHDVYTESEAIKRNIGYMSQKFSLYEDLSPRENIRLYGGIYDLTLKEIRERTDQMLSRLGMSAAASRPVRELPLGWRQKLALGRAAASAGDRISRRADQRRRSGDAPAVLGIDLRDGQNGHDRPRHHSLHG
jgi:ABC-2 type transport system ATP-binding protein